MTKITVRQAIQKGLREALENDPSVFLMGEDIGEYGVWNDSDATDGALTIGLYYFSTNQI